MLRIIDGTKKTIYGCLLLGVFSCINQGSLAMASYDPEQTSDKGPASPDPSDLQRIDTPLQDRLALEHARRLAVVKNLRSRIHFRVSQSMEYDDNIFATGSNQENGCNSDSNSNTNSNDGGCGKASDVITTTNLAVGFDVIKINRGKRLLRDFTLGVQYFLNYQVFMSHTEETHLSQFVAPTLTAPLAWVSGDGKFILSVRDDLRPVVNTGYGLIDPGSDLSPDYGAVQDRQIHYSVQNDFDALLTYRESDRGSVGWNYHNKYTYYVDKEVNNLNAMTHSTGPTASYVLGPRTSLFANGKVEWTTYQNNNSNGSNNSKSYQVQGGVRRQVASKSYFIFSSGYKWYQTGDSGAWVGGPTFHASYNQVISPRASYGLHASHEITGSREQTFRTRTLEEQANADNVAITQTTFGGNVLYFLGPQLSLGSDAGVSIEGGTGDQAGDSKDIFLYVRTTLRYYLTHHWTADLAYIFTTERGGNGGFDNGGNGDYVRNRYIATIRYQF